MIKGFFFDLDGTLVDTHQPNYEAYKCALHDFGVNISFEDFKQYIGEQARVFLPKLAPGLRPEEYAVIADKKAQYYKDVLHTSVLNVQLIRLIEDLQPDHTIALVTTAKKRNAEAVLTHHKLTRLFDFIITADDVKESKPSPESYQLALRNAGLTSSEALAFEDSETGMKAAEAAGIATVFIGKFKT